MYNVSQAYLTALASKAVTEAVEGTLVLPHSGSFEINDSCLVSGKLKLTKELCGEKYRIGTFNLSQLKFSFFCDSASSIDLTDGSVSLSYKLAPYDGASETVPLGTFYVDPILSSRKKDVIEIVAYDAGVRADREPSAAIRNMTGTPAEILEAVCEECGIDTDIRDDSLDAFPNSAVIVSPKDRQIQSCRDIIMWCAYLLCGYAVIDRSGKLVIISAKYTSTSGGQIISSRTVTAAERKYINATDTRAYIKYMSAYRDGDVVNYRSTISPGDDQAAPAAYALDKNPLLAGKSAAEYDAVNRAWLAYIDSFMQRGINACIYGDPAIDIGDTLMFRGGDVDQRGGIIGVVTSYEWTYRVGHIINCSAADCVGSLVGSTALSSTQTRSQTHKRIDAIDGGNGGTGGVGENVGYHNERFNGYTAEDGCVIQGGSYHDYNHAEGYKNTLTACEKTHVSGGNNTVTAATGAEVFGINNTVTGIGADYILGGYNNEVRAGISGSAIFGASHRIYEQFDHSLMAGQSNEILGRTDYTIVVGNANKVTGGSGNQILGQAHVVRYADGINHCLVCGTAANSSTLSVGAHNIRFLIGNAGNIFCIDGDGECYAAGGYSAMGADYAEYFEWADGNPENEDRCGMLVALDGDKIVPACGNGFLGVVSAAPSVVGNSPDLYWHGKYRTDAFGRKVRGEDGEPVLSENFDPEKQYIPRSARPEWSAVGLVGRLIVTDDGSCEAGGYCTAKNGIAAASKARTRARVLKRTDDTHVEVLIK